MEINVGRIRPKKLKSSFSSFTKLMFIGSAVVMISIASISKVESKYIMVSNEINEAEKNDDASAEPFGYFMGEWNLWEYIGDTVSSLFLW